MENKQCRICLKEKDVSKFRNSYLTKKFGFRKRSECIECETIPNRKRASEWYYKNRKKVLKNTKTDEHKEYRKVRRIENLSQFKAQEKRHRIKYKEKRNEYDKKWKEDNREYYNQIYLKRIDVILRGRVHSQERRIKIKELSDGTINIDSIKALLENQKSRCNICDIIISKENMHLDHIQPISKKGIHSIKNVQWLCAKCNLSKSNIWQDPQN